MSPARPVGSCLDLRAAWHRIDDRIPVVGTTSVPDDAGRREVVRLGAVLLPEPCSRATLVRVDTGASRQLHA